MLTLYEQLKSLLTSFGSDVYVKPTKRYYGFWHDTGNTSKVFAYVHVNPQSIDIDVKPALPLQSRVISEHYGKVCTRRISLRDATDLAEAKSLLRTCYQSR